MSKTKTITFTELELCLLREALWKAQCAEVRESCSRDFHREELYDKLKDKINGEEGVE